MTEDNLQSAPALWRVYGEIRGQQATSWRDAIGRTVVVVADDFPEAVALAEEALLHKWSKQPHVARVLSVGPYVVYGEPGDEWPVIWQRSDG